MGIRLPLAFSVYLLYSLRSFDCRVHVDRIVPHAHTADPTASEWLADTRALVRVKRHTSVSLIEPPSAPRNADQPKDRGLLSGGYEFDNAEDDPDDTTDTPAEEEPADTAEPAGEEEVVAPLILYLIVAGIILMTLALLIVGIAILYIICTIPSCEKDEEEDACGSIKDEC